MKYTNPKNKLGIEFEPDPLCETCFNPIDSDIRYCHNCREYVEGVTYCPDCNGKGKMDARDESKINSQTIIEPFHKVECDTCGGTGIKED